MSSAEAPASSSSTSQLPGATVANKNGVALAKFRAKVREVMSTNRKEAATYALLATFNNNNNKSGTASAPADSTTSAAALCRRILEEQKVPVEKIEATMTGALGNEAQLLAVLRKKYPQSPRRGSAADDAVAQKMKAKIRELLAAQQKTMSAETLLDKYRGKEDALLKSLAKAPASSTPSAVAAAFTAPSKSGAAATESTTLFKPTSAAPPAGLTPAAQCRHILRVKENVADAKIDAMLRGFVGNEGQLLAALHKKYPGTVAVAGSPKVAPAISTSTSNALIAPVSSTPIAIVVADVAHCQVHAVAVASAQALTSHFVEAAPSSTAGSTSAVVSCGGACPQTATDGFTRVRTHPRPQTHIHFSPLFFAQRQQLALAQLVWIVAQHVSDAAHTNAIAEAHVAYLVKREHLRKNYPAEFDEDDIAAIAAAAEFDDRPSPRSSASDGGIRPGEKKKKAAADGDSSSRSSSLDLDSPLQRLLREREQRKRSKTLADELDEIEREMDEVSPRFVKSRGLPQPLLALSAGEAASL